MSLTFPDPFSHAVVNEIADLLRQGEINDLTVVLDAQINSQVIPEWYRTNSISRIYVILHNLRLTLQERNSQEKVNALLLYMKEKCSEQIVMD
jgi:hypothetical protein